MIIGPAKFKGKPNGVILFLYAVPALPSGTKKVLLPAMWALVSILPAKRNCADKSVIWRALLNNLPKPLFQWDWISESLAGTAEPKTCLDIARKRRLKRGPPNWD